MHSEEGLKPEGGPVRLRKAAGPDLPCCYEVCLKTGDEGKDASPLFSDPFLLGQYYAAPYFFYDLSLCFVVEAGGLPGGYILAAGDTAAFNRWLEAQWLPPLRRRYPQPFPRSKSAAEQDLIALIHRPHAPPDDAPGPALPPWLASYPAHLHIDLLPEFQGRGWGRALMDALLEELWRRGCPGLHLGLGAANTGALAFYTRLNFSVLQQEPWGFVMGKKNPNHH
jgi:ribosomal protein S18 acetylase RimI-like enzyme